MTLFLKKGHFLSNITRGSVQLPDADLYGKLKQSRIFYGKSYITDHAVPSNWTTKLNHFVMVTITRTVATEQLLKA